MGLKIAITLSSNESPKGARMQNNVFYIDNVDGCRYLQIIGDDKHSYEAIWQNPNGKIMPVNHEVLCYYDDNQSLIKTQIFILQQQVNDYQQQL